ncbi:MAG: alginate lyase family protein [Nitrospirales bacterium]|nr:heparinase II/III family protein [Nitrospirales bacterium]
MSEALGATAPTDAMAFRHTLAWYAKRLRVMDPAEMCHRVGEHVVVRMLQIQHRFDWLSLDHPRQDLRQFVFCTSRTPQLPELPWAFNSGQCDSTRLLAGKLAVLGCEWQWRPDGEVWHEAPDTHKHWPLKFFGQISYRVGNPYGDVRVAWEPSRLQNLISLGLLARGAGTDVRRSAVALLEAQFLSWVDANPYLTGIHYISVMECGLRVLAVCHALDLAREWLQTSERIWPALLGLVHGHAELIRKRISGYSSTGNHTIAEAAALVYAGVLFPEMSQAERWRSLGLCLLEKEALHQILPDGGSAEQALWYHRFICDLYGLVVTLLQHHRFPVTNSIVEAFNRSMNFLETFASPSGRLPQVGDGDNGYALSPFLRFSKPDVLWVVGLTTFSESGYSIVRSETHICQQLVFDHGSLGMPPCFAHGHADALSVIFYCGDQEIMIDPGTYTYTGDAAWRTYFRGTRAHNTVIVDHLDQAVQETAFMWSQPFSARLIHRSLGPDEAAIAIARHDGYEGRLGVIHYRAVAYEPNGHWVIWDYLSGSGSHHLELNWHFAVEPVITKDGYILQWDGGRLHLTIDGGTTTLHKGDINPISGWRSAQYGMKESISTLRTKFTGILPHEFVTQIQVDGSVSPTQVLTTLEFFRGFVHETSAH